MTTMHWNEKDWGKMAWCILPEAKVPDRMRNLKKRDDNCKTQYTLKGLGNLHSISNQKFEHTMQ